MPIFKAKSLINEFCHNFTATVKFLFAFFVFLQCDLAFALSRLPPLSDLNLEEKAGQLLMVHFHGKDANDQAKLLIQEAHVGAIIYYNWSNELSDPCQVLLLSQGLQKIAEKIPHSLPLLIAIDQEGGLVNRIKKGVTAFPGNFALGQTGNLQWSEKSAEMMGRELKALGISMNLAPVVDVWIEPANPVIGIRAFSTDAEEVARFGKAALRGYKKAGISSALKHFPGHGDVLNDSHCVLPIVEKNRSQLDKEDLLPFRLLSQEADVIMTAHLSVPSLDPALCATFSKKMVTGILRNEFAFSGVVMTDSLAMEAILSQCPCLEDAVLKSIEAGHDLILLGGKQLLSSQEGWEVTPDDVLRVHRAIVNAVKEGRLSENRLDESVARILSLKQKYGLFDLSLSSCDDIMSEKERQPHAEMAEQIARGALRLSEGSSLLPLSFESLPLLIAAPDALREELSQTDWCRLGKSAQIFFFQGLSPDKETIAQISEEAKKCGRSFIFTYNAWQQTGQRELFNSLKSASFFTCAIACRDSLDAKELQGADILLCTFSPTACSLQAAFDRLFVFEQALRRTP